MRSGFYCLFLVVLCTYSTAAQLRADFSADKAGGCAPLFITFSNTSSGTSPNTSYEWDFGNGNQSVLQHAARGVLDGGTPR